MFSYLYCFIITIHDLPRNLALHRDLPVCACITHTNINIQNSLVCHFTCGHISVQSKIRNLCRDTITDCCILNQISPDMHY